jgi:septal ring factor EnvC (AmiA/AmiB activator)
VTPPRRTLIGLLALSWLLAAAMSPAGRAGGVGEGLAETAADLEAVRQQLGQARSRAAAIGGELTRLEREAQDISERLVATAETIKTREAMITAAEQRIAALDAEEGRLVADLGARRAQIAELLIGLQRLERNPPPPLVTRPDDALAAIRGAMLLGSIVPALERETALLNRALARLGEVRAAKLSERDDLAQHLTRLGEARGELEALLARKEILIAGTRSRHAEERERARALADKAETLAQLLDSLAEERRLAALRAHSEKKSAEEARAERLRRPHVAFTTTRGRLDYPAQGQKLREFGAADGYGGTAHGLYLATRQGAQVTAPADGEVEFAGHFRSYGQLLILNVGEGYHVLLAGLGEITTQNGQHVRVGEPLGVMGQSPARATLIGDLLDDPRPVLYIEFRKDGSAIDPAPWWVGSRKEALR